MRNRGEKKAWAPGCRGLEPSGERVLWTRYEARHADTRETPRIPRPAAPCDPMNDLRATPNLLTFLRLCIAPFLVLGVLDGHYPLAFGLFVLAGITDAMDGLLARVLNQQTMLGQYLDPVVDKLMLSTLFLVLHHEGLISLRVTVLVFARDLGILMVAATLYATTSIRNFKPTIFGKSNTVAQIVAVAAVILSQFFAPVWVVLLRDWALGATVLLTLVSGFHYAWRAMRQIGSAGATA